MRISSRSNLPSCLLGTLAILAGGSLSLVHAQSSTGTPKRTFEVARATAPIDLDGVLDEAAWQSAAPMGDLIQRQPNPGTSPSERTDVRLLHDEDFLYIGVVAFDSEPDQILATRMARDASIGANDRIEILLDTFQNQRNAFYFATNPTGALIDGLAFGSQDLNTNWNAIWDLRTSLTDEGWIAEIAIPFKSLNFPANSSTWGFNLSRTIHRKQEENMWSGGRLENDFLQIAQAGEISGLEGLKQGRGLDIRPFVAGSWVHSAATGQDEFDAEPGLDFFYNLTPSLKLTGTVNTDFGETEVDARQINLTRFSLFFPEKRSFFLEDVGVFDFASTGPQPPGGVPSAGADVYPFFSRRIGLSNGSEVPLEFGMKLTGKVGSTEVGLLGVRTDATSFVNDKDFVVARLKQNLFEQSYVGGIFAKGDSRNGLDGKTYGADINLSTSQFGDNNQNLVFNAFALASERDGVNDDDNKSFGFSLRYPNDKWDGMLVMREIQANFDPGIGFVQRDNVRMYRGAVSYNPRPKDFMNIQQMFHDVYYTHFERLDIGQRESSAWKVTPLDWHFRSGDSIHALADIDHTFERLFTPFQIAPGVILPPGDYDNVRSGIVLASATKRRLSAFVNFGYGGFWSGTAEQLSTTISYNLPPRFSFQLRTNQTFAHLPEGDFIARTFTSTFNYAVSPQLSFSNLVQYDNRSRNLGWQSRVRWTLRPGSDLFISFNQGWLAEDTGSLRLATLDTKLAGKLQYTYRF
ncbi:MAG: carbohydrate binding family 9 domain-containing protein [Opitutaceae bacterium]|nr:carbohydrate binding family 9 domain-containing protein [Opitutaceae bacterium]